MKIMIPINKNTLVLAYYITMLTTCTYQENIETPTTKLVVLSDQFHVHVFLLAQWKYIALSYTREQCTLLEHALTTQPATHALLGGEY